MYNENNQIKPIKTMCATIGMLPSSYNESMTYEEQLWFISNKLNELINFANNNLTDEFKKYIDMRFSDIILDTMYDATTETLIMYLNKKE